MLVGGDRGERGREREGEIGRERFHVEQLSYVETNTHTDKHTIVQII